MLGTIRTLLGFLKPYPGVLPTVAVLGVLASFAEGLGIVLMIPFLASLTSGGAEVVGDGTGAVTRALNAYAALFPPDIRLAIVAVTIALLIVLSCVINVAYVSVFSRTATRVSHDLRVGLFERFVRGDDAFLAKGSQGRQIKAIDGSAHRAGQATISLFLLLVNAVTVLVVLGLLAAISWRMTAVVLLGVACAGLVVRVFVTRSMGVSARYEQRASALSDATIQVLGSLRVVRIFGQQGREVAELSGLSETVRQEQTRLEVVRRTMAPLVDGVAAPMLVGGLVLASRAEVDIAVLLPFLLLVFRLQRYAREFDVCRVRIAADAGAIHEVVALTEKSEKTIADAGKTTFGGLKHDIAVDRVSFVYPGVSPPAPSVEEITFRVRRGETLGIVGGSGAGKSTVIDLLCALHEPTTGTIRVDGVPLDRFDPASWRRRIGFAGQDADLLAGTVRENIAYGDPTADIAEVREAARLAGADAFVDALPRGYDTPVGVRGMQLSGGERQRIALARALLRRPDLLILDEATNALDNATEALVRETLERLSGTLTMIVIAHRLASVRSADRVLVLDGGRIIEEGRPDSLLDEGGAFSELSRLESVR